ncbi:MAG TPA: glutamate racemase [Tepidisphaeraceae bacterium]|nr:glutamate racemase [Tepidisphaeraceae bacterium]
MAPSSPIVVIDSGLGGLTVVRALRHELPKEDIVYFGDTARLPYGSKTAATVCSFVRQIITYLLSSNPKHVVIACNTATALALQAAQHAFPGLPITGVIEPGAKGAVIAAGSKMVPTIAVLATEATVRSKAYERAIHRRRHHARLLMRPAPLLCPIIEEGRTSNDPLVRLALNQYLEPLIRNRMDVLVLGCTHYPIYRELIQEMTGKVVPVIDSAQQCAEDVARRLKIAGMLHGKPGEGTLRCVVTDDPERFRLLAPRFLGMEIDKPAWVHPEALYEPATVPSPIRLSQSA